MIELLLKTIGGWFASLQFKRLAEIKRQEELDKKEYDRLVMLFAMHASTVQKAGDLMILDVLDVLKTTKSGKKFRKVVKDSFITKFTTGALQEVTNLQAQIIVNPYFQSKGLEARDELINIMDEMNSAAHSADRDKVVLTMRRLDEFFTKL